MPLQEIPSLTLRRLHQVRPTFLPQGGRLEPHPNRSFPSRRIRQEHLSLATSYHNDIVPLGEGIVG